MLHKYVFLSCIKYDHPYTNITVTYKINFRPCLDYFFTRFSKWLKKREERTIGMWKRKLIRIEEWRWKGMHDLGKRKWGSGWEVWVGGKGWGRECLRGFTLVAKSTVRAYAFPEKNKHLNFVNLYPHSDFIITSLPLDIWFQVKYLIWT